MGLQVFFVLVEAAVPENVGFAIRAIKTMGFNQMRLVNCCDHLSRGARTTAYGSHDVLEACETYGSIEDALADIDLSVGTTAKGRIARHDIYRAEDLPGLVQKKEDTIHSLGMVFGSEEHGLTKDQLELCHVVSSIPLATTYPSLNLAQAVLLYAYELSAVPHPVKKDGPIGEMEQRAVRQKAVEILDKLEVQRQPSLYQRLKDRLMTAGAEDIRLMLSLIKYIERKI